MTTVPDGMPFSQQVELAKAAKAEGDRLAAPPAPVNSGPQLPSATTGAGSAWECKALAQEIRAVDAVARQPQTGPTQDRLTAQRRAARDRQRALGCQ